jgi:16S rRNA (guanine527-N7)-methyltransferase
MSNASPLRSAATRLEAPSPAGALDRFGFVTDPAKVDLKRFVALLSEWQRVHNLVARKALDEVWTRHVADSLQLLQYAPLDFRQWVDLGSGAGFPGLVVAIASRHRDERRPHFTLVESNAKKVAFLRAAIRTTGANASVANERIEAHAAKMAGQADVISARALAPLSDLLELASHYAHKDTLMLFPKGKEHVQERLAASQSFDFDVVDYPSATDSGGRVLAIRNVSPKARP